MRDPIYKKVQIIRRRHEKFPKEKPLNDLHVYVPASTGKRLMPERIKCAGRCAF
jgi:hypothetical protein